MSIFTFYVIGAIVAFIISWKEASILYKQGTNIDDAPAAFIIISMLSWFYVALCLKRYLDYFEKDCNKHIK